MEENFNIINNVNKILLKIIEKYLSIYNISKASSIYYSLPIFNKVTLTILPNDEEYFVVRDASCCSFIQSLNQTITIIENGTKRNVSIWTLNIGENLKSVRAQNPIFYSFFNTDIPIAYDDDMIELIQNGLYEELFEYYFKKKDIKYEDFDKEIKKIIGTKTIDFNLKTIVKFYIDKTYVNVKNEKSFNDILKYWESRFGSLFNFYYTEENNQYVINIKINREITYKRFLLAAIEIARAPFSVESIHVVASYILENELNFKFNKVFSLYQLSKNIFYYVRPSVIENIVLESTGNNNSFIFSREFDYEKDLSNFHSMSFKEVSKIKMYIPLSQDIFNKRISIKDVVLNKYNLSFYEESFNTLLPDAYIMFDILTKDNELFNKIMTDE